MIFYPNYLNFISLSRHSFKLIDNLIVQTVNNAAATGDAPTEYKVGDVVVLSNLPDIQGIVRYVGLTQKTDHIWVGLEYPSPIGKRY